MADERWVRPPSRFIAVAGFAIWPLVVGVNLLGWRFEADTVVVAIGVAAVFGVPWLRRGVGVSEEGVRVYRFGPSVWSSTLIPLDEVEGISIRVATERKRTVGIDTTDGRWLETALRDSVFTKIGWAGSFADRAEADLRRFLRETRAPRLG